MRRAEPRCGTGKPLCSLGSRIIWQLAGGGNRQPGSFRVEIEGSAIGMPPSIRTAAEILMNHETASGIADATLKLIGGCESTHIQK